jgi:hypothetical protein
MFFSKYFDKAELLAWKQQIQITCIFASSYLHHEEYAAGLISYCWTATTKNSITTHVFYCILEQLRQCGILCFSIVFWNCSDSVVFCVFLLYFGTAPTVAVPKYNRKTQNTTL